MPSNPAEERALPLIGIRNGGKWPDSQAKRRFSNAKGFIDRALTYYYD
jgi:hypothetical protein